MTPPKLVATFCVLLSLIRPSWGESFLEEQKLASQTLRTLLTDYDVTIRPQSLNQDGDPVQVRIGVYIRNIYRLDETNGGEMTMQVAFRQSWVDPRLRFSQNATYIRFINIRDPYILWRPNVVFSNLLNARLHKTPEPNVLVRLYPNGTVFYSQRISLHLSCPMNLQRFPHDKQRCPLTMTSHGYTSEDVQYSWHEIASVTVARPHNLKLFTLDRYEIRDCKAKSYAGTFSCLTVDLIFQRLLSSYVRGFYIPSLLLVILAWLTFWLHHQAAFVGRIIMASTVLLATTLLCADVHRSSVPTGYSKPIDTWTGLCFTFVFASIAELVLIQWLAIRQPGNRTGQDTESSKELLEATISDTEDAGNFSMQPFGNPDTVSVRRTAPGRQPFWQRCWRTLLSYPPPERVDVLHRIGYPVIFAFFQLCYWATYLP